MEGNPEKIVRGMISSEKFSILGEPERRGGKAMRSVVSVWVMGFTIMIVAGCVSPSRYAIILQQLETAQKELHDVKAEALALSQEVTRLDELKQEARADMLATTNALQDAQEEAKAERRTAEGNFVTLHKAINQLSAQLLTLRDELAEAKADTVALKEMAATYQMKLHAEPGADESIPLPEDALPPEQANPELTAPPQAEPPPAVASAQPPPPARSLFDDQPPPPPAESPDDSLFSFIFEWLNSLWQALGSFWHKIFS
jgi:hypothetical protein